MTKPVAIPSDRLEYLEFLIAESRDACTFARKTAIWLVQHSNGLTRSVQINLPDSKQARSVSTGFHNMISTLRRTHVNEVLHAMGSALIFGHAAMAGGSSIVWLSSDRLGLHAEILEFNQKEIQQIDLNINLLR